MTYLETLKQSAEAIGLTLSDEALRRFEIYKDELLETNRFLNLTAITDPEEVAVKHMVDSLTIYNENASIIGRLPMWERERDFQDCL